MENCIFCNFITEKQIIHQTPHFKVVFDIDPIQTGHLLIISKDHYESMTELPKPLLHELIELQAKLIAALETSLPIAGVTSASNDKELMDTGTHFHLHLIPRRKNDGFWDKLEIPTEDWDLNNFLKTI
ncbi:HIT family protein [Streptococcus gallinaceus]|uniref:Diadenosine tetraphosphate (Ap4A) HIT family hydrolase n=1 Tax=Streptococcus gallinaceus TaxID=165758 RepID=A0ABV2JLZ9_9STRE|nr:HIT family protein [Streptococcus gallinaceus]MCP1639860.1 diadenosine tetraphosphate (Ap4A) HIT family hydrolase [Streptococcus gallinaceus]MCP1770768.1 diadenosine tetraphosphate (Ap4A) HIT family hydrolase [Streptococcus gallinaceus]